MMLMMPLFAATSFELDLAAWIDLERQQAKFGLTFITRACDTKQELAELEEFRRGKYGEREREREIE